MYKITVFVKATNRDGHYVEEVQTAKTYKEMTQVKAFMVNNWFHKVCPYVGSLTCYLLDVGVSDLLANGRSSSEYLEESCKAQMSLINFTLSYQDKMDAQLPANRRVGRNDARIFEVRVDEL